MVQDHDWLEINRKEGLTSELLFPARDQVYLEGLGPF